MKKGQLVIIYWEDSANHCIGWQPKAKNHSAKIETVGFVSDVSKKTVTVVQSVVFKGTRKGDVSGAISIPRASILKQAFVTEVK